jgi:hypothetical protein
MILIKNIFWRQQKHGTVIKSNQKRIWYHIHDKRKKCQKYLWYNDCQSAYKTVRWLPMSWMSVRINFGITGVGQLRSPSVCSWVRVTRSMSVCSPFIHGFWLPPVVSSNWSMSYSLGWISTFYLMSSIISQWFSLQKVRWLPMPWMSVGINFGIAGVQITGRSIQKYLKGH